MTKEIVIITEDAYGGEFFRRLLERLSSESIVDVRLKKNPREEKSYSRSLFMQS